MVSSVPLDRGYGGGDMALLWCGRVNVAAMWPVTMVLSLVVVLYVALVQSHAVMECTLICAVQFVRCPGQEGCGGRRDEACTATRVR